MHLPGAKHQKDSIGQVLSYSGNIKNSGGGGEEGTGISKDNFLEFVNLFVDQENLNSGVRYLKL